jgi:hypothetical protein
MYLSAANPCRQNEKAPHMSFKEFSIAQNVPDKNGSADKNNKEAVPAGPDPQSDQKPAEVAPTPKS